MPAPLTISGIRHPKYNADYTKWRTAYEGGRLFLNSYLINNSKNEDLSTFELRKRVSYVPAFAKSAINDIKNNIYQRLVEIRRLEGSKAYQDAVAGKDGGVDGAGMSMNAFIGQYILSELIVLSKVGVMVDMPPKQGALKSQNVNRRPYLYYFCAEDILSWTWDQNILTNVLLRVTETDYAYGTLTSGTSTFTRHMYLNPLGPGVIIDDYLFNAKEKKDYLKTRTILDLPMLPFVLLDLGQSLMCDVVDYQIALTNLASTDLNFLLEANKPFYTEQVDPTQKNIYGKRHKEIDLNTGLPISQTDRVGPYNPVEASDDIEIGTIVGRQYMQGLNSPAFIAPPDAPLKSSMAKQEQMKAELRQVINLGLASLETKHASAESKKADDRGLEAGLSCIGLELEYGERQIAKIWAIYEGSDPATINYPEKYDLKSDFDRVELAKSLMELKYAAPSRTYSKKVSEDIARIMLGTKITAEDLAKIVQEITDADYVSSGFEEIASDIMSGIVDKETASNARGYNGKKVVPIADKEHKDRLAAIAQAQSVNAAGQGTTNDANQNKDVKTVSQNPDLNPASGGSLTRGPGK